MIVIAGGKRQLCIGAGVNHRTQLGGFGLQNGLSRRYFDRFTNAANFELEVDLGDLIQLQHDGRFHRRRKTCALCANLIVPDREALQVVGTILIADCRIRRASVKIFGGYFDVSDGGARGVGDHSINGCGHILGGDGARNEQSQAKQDAKQAR